MTEFYNPEDEYTNDLTEKITELEKQNADLVVALEDLLMVAKHYKPIPKGYNPEEEDGKMWAIGMIYTQAEIALTKAEK